MEENLEPNNELSENTSKSNSEEIEEPNPEEVINMIENNPESQNNSVPKVDLKKESSKPSENNPESQNNSVPKVDLKKESSKPSENNPESQNNSVSKVDLKEENPIPSENIPESQNNSLSKVEIKNGNDIPVKNIPKPKKELPIEKKPFQEFVNVHLIPSLKEEINQRGLEINDINLQNTNRPIAGDKCWVIKCQIKDTCNFWLSFEKEDISSLKSISLSKPNQKPSIIESFLIDEKRITLKLIISRVVQRLNGQKLIGVN